MGANLPMATGSGQGGDEYEQSLIDKYLSQGVTPEQLAQNRFISSDPKVLGHFRQYYKPSRDVVYTQPPAPAPVPPPAPVDSPVWGSSMVRFYNNKGHALGDGSYASRNSTRQADAGTLNTAKQDLRLQLLNRMGQPEPDQVYVFPGHVVDSLTGGTHTFRDTTGFSRYRVPPPPGHLSSRFPSGGGYGPFFFRYL